MRVLFMVTVSTRYSFVEPSHPHSQFIKMQIDDLYLAFRLQQKYYTYLGMLIDLGIAV